MMIAPRDSDRGEVVTTFLGALAGTQDGADHLVDRSLSSVGRGVESVVVDDRAVGLDPFNQRHSHRRRSQRHTQNDVHWPSNSVCYATRGASRHTARIHNQRIYRPDGRRRYPMAAAVRIPVDAGGPTLPGLPVGGI